MLESIYKAVYVLGVNGERQASVEMDFLLWFLVTNRVAAYLFSRTVLSYNLLRMAILKLEQYMR